MKILDKYISSQLTQDNFDDLHILADFMQNMNAYHKNKHIIWHIDTLKKTLCNTSYYIYILNNDNKNNDKEKIIGVSIWLENSHIKEYELLYIGILPHYQNQKIAHNWLQYLLFKNKGYITHLEVRASNIGAQKLYVKNGFAIVGRRKNYYPIYNNEYTSSENIETKQIITREDAILMNHE